MATRARYRGNGLFSCWNLFLEKMLNLHTGYNVYSCLVFRDEYTIGILYFQFSYELC